MRRRRDLGREEAAPGQPELVGGRETSFSGTDCRSDGEVAAAELLRCQRQIEAREMAWRAD